MRQFWSRSRKLNVYTPVVAMMIYPSYHQTSSKPILCNHGPISPPADPSKTGIQEGRSLTYLGKGGMRISEKLRLEKLPVSGRGWVCGVGSISDGECIIHVPADFILDAYRVESDPRFAKVVGPLRSAGLDDRGVIALWYITSMRRRFEDWTPYLNLLPNRYDLSNTHVLLSDECLPNTSVSFTANRMRANISRQLKSILQVLRQIESDNDILSMDIRNLEDEWKYCHALVLSRSGLFDDMACASDWTEQPIAIIPAVDLVNHSDAPNARIERGRDGSVRLVATKEIVEGEEITISYWSKNLTTEQVLFSFGFMGGDPAFLLPMISFDEINTSKKRALQRLIHIETNKEFDHQSDGILTNNPGAAVNYFAIECMPENALSALAHSFVKESGYGSESGKIIANYRDAGKTRLRKEIESWRYRISITKVTHSIMIEYKRQLLDALDTLLREIR